MKRWAAPLLAALWTLMMTSAWAEPAWPELTTEGQNQLRAYVQRVDANLTAQGMPVVNSLFELYEGFANLGVTAADNAELPEGVEMTFLLDAAGPTLLTLRVSDGGRFVGLAAACVQACSPAAITLEEAQAEPARLLKRTTETPLTALKDEVDPTPGSAPRVYFAYHPNQYNDGVNWWEMTLVFPLPGSLDAPLAIPPEAVAQPTVAPDTYYGPNTYQDDYAHLEVFTTPTPEPDSAANEP